MQWLRLYDDLLDDPKAQQLPAPLFKHWINLLCLANKGEPRGVLPDMNAISFRLRLPLNKAESVIEQLVALGLLDTDDVTLQPHNWSHRQRNSDDGAARQRKHRGNVTSNKDVTLHVTDVSLSRAIDTDTDTDTDTDPTGLTPPIRPPIATAPSTPQNPPNPPPPQAPKPITPRKAAANLLFERRMAIFTAYCRGLDIDPESLPAEQRKGRSLTTLSTAILDTEDCTAETVEALTRYTKSAYQWRNGKKTPELTEVLAAFPEWDQAGRPEEVPRPIKSGKRPQQNGRLGYTMDELQRLANGEDVEPPRDDKTAYDARFRVVK